MSTILVLTTIFIFLTIFVESMNLILQLKGKMLTKYFGKKAFDFHIIIVGMFWIITFCFIVILQFQEHPLFHNNLVIKYIGLTLLFIGLILAIWAFYLLGLKRSLCINFFEEKVPTVKSSLYKYIKNPEDTGFWIALIGFALFTESVYNLIIAIEFIVIMIPHVILENIKLK